MIEIIQLLVAFKSVDGVLEGCGGTRAEHTRTAVEAFGSEPVRRRAPGERSVGRQRDGLICQKVQLIRGLPVKLRDLS
jgi:hypothetical protein